MSRQRLGPLFDADRCTCLQHGVKRPFADEHAIRCEHRKAPPLEVVGDFRNQTHLRDHVRGDHAVHWIRIVALQPGVECRQCKHVITRCACGVKRFVDLDNTARQRAGLVATEQRHRPDVFDGVESLHE